MPQNDTGAGPTRGAKTMSAGQRAYEARRAEKAGVGLQKWIDDKDQAKPKAAPPAKKTNRLTAAIGKLLDRAHRPLDKS